MTISVGHIYPGDWPVLMAKPDLISGAAATFGTAYAAPAGFDTLVLFILGPGGLTLWQKLGAQGEKKN